MRQKLIKKVVDATAPVDRPVLVWDTEVKGFGLKVTPNGRKTYILQYRLGGRGTPTQRYQIGAHGDLTPDQARTEAERLKGELAKGIDPIQQRRTWVDASEAERRAQTVAILANQFLADHARVHLKPRTIDLYEKLVDRFLKPELGQLKAKDVTRAHIEALHRRLRRTPRQANMVLTLAGVLFAWAEPAVRPLNSNPARGLKKFPEHARRRYLDEAELARLAAALAAAERGEPMQRPPSEVPLKQEPRPFRESPYAVAAIRLLLFTGARLSEILTLQWREVDLDQRLLRLADSKTGRKEVVLNAAAVAVLQQLEALRVARNPYVIVGERDGKHLVNLEKPWQRIRYHAELEDLRLHDLRHSFASFAVGAGLSLRVIGGLLGHTSAQTTQRYAHLMIDPARQATERIADRLGEALARRQQRLPSPPERAE